MILEAMVKKTKNALFAVVGDKHILIRPHGDKEGYSFIYQNLEDEEPIIIDFIKDHCNLKTDFNSEEAEYFFQRIFGNSVPREKLTFYQQRIFSILPKVYRD